MNSKMNIFEVVQRYYATLGITSSNQLTNNGKIFAGFLVFGWCIALHAMYMFRVANDFIEYVECSCSLSANIIIFVSFLAVIFRRTSLFQIINNIRKLIDTSKDTLSNQYFKLLVILSNGNLVICSLCRVQTFKTKTNLLENQCAGRTIE